MINLFKFLIKLGFQLNKAIVYFSFKLSKAIVHFSFKLSKAIVYLLELRQDFSTEIFKIPIELVDVFFVVAYTFLQSRYGWIGRNNSLSHRITS